MATPFTKQLPTDGEVYVTRGADGQLRAYQVRVQCIGWLDEVRVQGRKVYVTRDGKVYSDAHQAALSLTGDSCSP